MHGSSRSSARAIRAALLLPILRVLTGCTGGEVVRVFDGQEVVGRFVSDWAYAAYAHGAEAEARGRHGDALRFYLEAAEHDPDSVEVWTKVGAMRCRLGVAGADEAFSEAEDNDPEYEPLWRERAICAERAGDKATALAHAAHAVSLDPERDDTLLLYARLLDANGKRADAERWLRSLAVRAPHSTPVWEALAQHARLANDQVLLAEAQGRIDRMRHDPEAGLPRAAEKGGWRSVDDALVSGSLDGARRRARQAHLDVRMLAARAIVAGRPQLALEEADLRLGADPDDTDARVALALAADLTGDSERAGATMAAMPASAEPLSEVGRLLYAELLVRHAGSEAAADWLGIPADALAGVDGLRQRLRETLDRTGKATK